MFTFLQMLHLYGDANMNYKLTTTQFNSPALHNILYYTYWVFETHHQQLQNFPASSCL